MGRSASVNVGCSLANKSRRPSISQNIDLIKDTPNWVEHHTFFVLRNSKPGRIRSSGSGYRICPSIDVNPFFVERTCRGCNSGLGHLGSHPRKCLLDFGFLLYGLHSCLHSRTESNLVSICSALCRNSDRTTLVIHPQQSLVVESSFVGNLRVISIDLPRDR